jgi:hypothetical protein
MVFKKRWRHKKAVFLQTPQRMAPTDGEPIDECLGIVFPALGLAQSGQAGVGEDRTGAQTLFAAVATQSSAPTLGVKWTGLA